MRKLALLVLFSVILLVSAGSVAASGPEGIPGASGTIWATERALGTASAFNAATGELLWTTTVGASPIGITQPHGTRWVYTSDEGSNRMSVLDRETGALVTTIPMGSLPHHLTASRNGKYVYVGEFGHNEIGVVDTATNTRVAGFVANPDPLARTHMPFVTQNGNDLYATNSRADRTQPGDVAHLDARTGALLCNTSVGADPSEILTTANGKVGYVSVRRENKVKELDLTGDCPVLTGREVVVGTMPDTLQLTNDQRTLVVALRGTPAQITLVDTDTFTARIVAIPGHTTTGHHWLSANGKYSFVGVENPAGIAVVDNETGETIADYPYPSGTRVHGIFYAPEVLR
jgi:DNA-binding beta-propeller fold protein YncE